MTIYFQHVGERGGNRDFPKTIGDSSGLRGFHLLDIQSFLSKDDRRQLPLLPSHGFQIWGIPSGAKQMLKSLVPGDWVLLLKSDRPGGQFYYAGRVLYRLSNESFELSRHLWGEARFPIILFLEGCLTSYPWEAFRENLGYNSKWRLAGNTFRVLPDRLATSSYRSEEALISALIGDVTSEQHDEVYGATIDQVELLQPTLEGRQRLREHLVRERDPALIRKFKEGLRSFACSVCNFDFEKVYGDIGHRFVEAHHVEPIGMREGDSITSVTDLVPVCSNCHRMLHRRAPPYSPEDLERILATTFECR